MNTIASSTAKHPASRGTRLRWLAAGALALGAFLWQGQAEAGGRSDQIAGAIIGAGFGAVIGQHMGGHDGAIVGGAIGAATGAAVAGHDGRRVYRTHGPTHRVHGGHQGPGARHHGGNVWRAPNHGPARSYGHSSWVGTLAAPQVVIVNPPRGYVHGVQRSPRVVYHPRRPDVRGHRHGVVRGHPGRAVQRAYRQGVRDGLRISRGHRY